ncbi:MAG: hypothetical protein WDZ69_02920 [Candidatus Pacearchaeota archaeon]
MKKPPRSIERKVLAMPQDYQPLSERCEVVGTFNPAAVHIKTKKGLETLLMIRVAERPIEENPDYVNLPSFEIKNQEQNKLKMEFERYKKSDLLWEGERSVKVPDEHEGHYRLKDISLPRLLRLNEEGDVIERSQKPAIFPSYEYERFGMEDFRITPFEDKYILTYVVPHRQFGVSTGILLTKDFKNYKRLPEENTPRPSVTAVKDVILFPKKVPSPSSTELIKKGQPIYAGFIRPNAFSEISSAGIWISYSPDLVHWGQDHRLTPESSTTTGSGTPPIELNDSWLAAYHETTKNPQRENNYTTMLMKLNKRNPWENFKTSDVFLKREDYNSILPKRGYVPNVVFSSGITNLDGITTIYSGADDQWTVGDKSYTEDLSNFVDES